MRNLARLNLPKASSQERVLLMDQVSRFVQTHVKPLKIIFFGSITTDQFDEISDIDVIVVFNSPEQATKGRKLLYGAERNFTSRPIDILCVDEKSFEEKSSIGGVYYIAKESGTRVDYGKK